MALLFSWLNLRESVFWLESVPQRYTIDDGCCSRLQCGVDFVPLPSDADEQLDINSPLECKAQIPVSTSLLKN